ncbi:MAG: FKBP-type peptidyl-prolyl cis-trans isomerase [Actinobacteria bacterium]|nr:FKBP-type peptidyl-prolyl cis-trans isomerase [Actinomycetota bacterium]
MSEKPLVTVPDSEPSGTQLKVDDLVIGAGDEAKSGHAAEVHYVGVSWKTGNEFDASWNRNETFKFKLGGGQVIPGWDQGVIGMKVGGRRQLTIPPALAYGTAGAGGVIGPNEHLIFVVDLISLR